MLRSSVMAPPPTRGVVDAWVVAAGEECCAAFDLLDLQGLKRTQPDPWLFHRLAKQSTAEQAVDAVQARAREPGQKQSDLSHRGLAPARPAGKPARSAPSRYRLPRRQDSPGRCWRRLSDGQSAELTPEA